MEVVTGGRDSVTVGVVVIGRNEGKRLEVCLDSLNGLVGRVIYVDSGSTDNSIEMARARGVAAVELDMSVPFTAARARNQGFQRLCELAPQLAYVQFVDGDCEIVSGWIEQAAAWLDERPDVAAVCGRRRERYPDRSIYNRLCDMEWDTPVGEAKACGGDVLVRITAFAEVKGYRSDLIAGEEPEMCVRLRKRGWRIWRLDLEMTLHDAAIMRFGQWWKRTLRSGYADAQGASLHGAAPERHGVRQLRSARFWSLGVPLGTVGLALWWGPWVSVLLLAYPIQVVRLALRDGGLTGANWWRAGFLVLGKFPELLGQIKFLIHRHVGGQIRIIEYK